ncbi:acyl-CoA dehydrogenase family protein [Streptomyces spongiae]|uniref:Acyl-CoA dehydrogenase n=1 Tax=Streptomyces spongiae TaxID=565072 RepID=A0A5N8X916_9ACTN|nr:acyl-CoA dehydrogenase family protein [Streptomyces spongiae]MPY55666.1 acyl-CoA dehydrogenase [Streptomyces spongiae]
MKRRVFDVMHEQLRSVARDFAEREVAPHLDEWSAAGAVDRALYAKAGALGLLGMGVDERHGGGGEPDFRYSVVINEELTRVGATSVVMGLSGFNDLVAPYLDELCTDQQKARWLPQLCAGERVAALAMTEPGTGSDLKGIATTAVADGDDYLLNGTKTFISNGILADLVVVVAKTDPAPRSGHLSLFVVERDMPGFSRGRKLDKIGLAAQDTAELFFDNVRVARGNLLGKEGEALSYLRQNLVRERLSVAVTAAASMERAFDHVLSHTAERHVFGQPLTSFQATRFTLAELATEVQIARVFVDRCIDDYVHDGLSDIEAAMAKWWTTELQQRVLSQCLQLHGGYGFMREYAVAREFLDARASTLYAGTTEIMKEIIGRAVTREPSQRLS